MNETIITKDTVGDIWAWGRGNWGQLGNGFEENISTPNKITEFSNTNTIINAWTMSDTIIAKDSIGDIWSWGSGDYGQNGDGNQGEGTIKSNPSKITEFSGTNNTIVDAWTMSNAIIAKDDIGDIWSWGSGSGGQLGNGSTLNNTRPEKIAQFSGTNSTIVDAWTMNNTIIAKDDVGDIWSWGQGVDGQLGNGNTADNPTPEKITQFSSANTIVDAWTMDRTIIAKDSIGDIWSWGLGNLGQNGSGSYDKKFTAERIHDVDGATNVFGQGVTIEEAWTMDNTIIARDTTGDIWSWGFGFFGQIGDGTNADKNAPVKITKFNSTNTIVNAWVMDDTIIAKDTAGDIWSWGDGRMGQNGDGEEIVNNTPEKITQFNNNNTIEEAWVMDDTIIAKDTAGDIWSWGKGDLGQNGDGEESNNSSPEKIFSEFNLGSIKLENITTNSATVTVEDFTNGIGVNLMTKATLTYGVSGGTSQTMDDTNLDDGISFELTGLTEGQNYDLSIAYFNASDTQIGSPVTPESPLVTPRPPSSGGGGLSTGAIIGIAVGAGGAVLIGGGVGGFFLYKKKRGF